MFTNILNTVTNTIANTVTQMAGDVFSQLTSIIDGLNIPSVEGEGYTTGPNAESWMGGIPTQSITQGILPQEHRAGTQTGSPVPAQYQSITYQSVYKNDLTGFRDLNAEERKSIGSPSGLKIDGSIQKTAIQTYPSDPEKRKLLTNENVTEMQNAEGFPEKVEETYNGSMGDFKKLESNQLKVARYDYRIQVGDTRYSLMRSLEDELMKARASLGIPVHGQQDIARAMKYYMYNRYKTPDTNMAHNKTVTHIFFTRPDLNILDYNGGANAQTRNHSEAAMVWKRNPDIFKLLTDHKRCKDSNNFNLLLSNQVTSFDIQDEQLTYVEAGKSWAEYTMNYGDAYSGRTAGNFSCNFVDTNDYSIINLIKLWITYIDNVARGAWRPSYDLHGNGGVSKKPNMSHVYSKTLDYAASCYVFKCGPDGEEVLYWSKYFGIFPINTGAQALSWELTSNIGDAPRLNIQFRYSFKRDLSPISLLEFNSISNVSDMGAATFETSFNPEYGHSSRPYVGAPFIQMKFFDPKGFPTISGASIGPNASTSSIRLKFRPESDSRLTDDQIYRASMANRSVASISSSSTGSTMATAVKTAAAVGALAGVYPGLSALNRVPSSGTSDPTPSPTPSQPSQQLTWANAPLTQAQKIAALESGLSVAQAVAYFNNQNSTTNNTVEKGTGGR